eukprot:30799-Pelagococcus_subviridis.AAC.9
MHVSQPVPRVRAAVLRGFLKQRHRRLVARPHAHPVRVHVPQVRGRVRVPGGGGLREVSKRRLVVPRHALRAVVQQPPHRRRRVRVPQSRAVLIVLHDVLLSRSRAGPRRVRLDAARATPKQRSVVSIGGQSVERGRRDQS